MAKLAAIPARLTETVDGQPFILSLFQPEPETRRLFESALAFQRAVLGGVWALLTRFWRFPAAALVLALVALLLGVTGTAGAAVVIPLVAIAPWILVLGVIRDVTRALGAVAGNDFGLCRLGPRADGRQALTAWLHEVVQDLAGRTESDGR